MKKTILLLIMSISLFGCSQDALEEGMTTEEVQAIASASDNIVQDAITKAINENTQINPQEIAEQISKIEGVVSAGLNATNSGVNVDLEGGLSSLVLLINKADNRWYVENNENKIPDETITTKNTTTNIVLPKGNGRALILAPFQYDFKSDLDKISEKLESAGYIVDSFIDSQASLEKFRGDFLSQYDIVIIDSHGAILNTNRKEQSTGIATATVWTKESFRAMSNEERVLLSDITINSVAYYAITPQWLRATTTKNFKNTWIFNASCEGAYYDVGNPSLSKAFLDLGAKGYNGFDFNINIDLSNLMMHKMVDNFSDKQNFLEASEKTENATYPIFMVIKYNFLLEGTIAALFGKETTYIDDGIAISPDFFDTHQRGEDPFYIVPPDGYKIIPTVNLSSIDNITGTTADCDCEVTSEGWRRVIARGVCWSTTQDPTTSNSKTTNGTGLGTYTSNITGLSPNTTYYVRAYATNSQGTAYGEQRTFRTLTASDIEYGSFTDSRDGIVYKTVTIGEQVWMAENLAYLPSVSLPSSGSYGSPYYYVYDYNTTNVADAKATINYQTYGVLYNWPAAMNGASASNANPSGVQGVCPEGWHLPSDKEWTQLETYLARNGYQYDGSTDVANIGGHPCPHLNIAAALVANIGWESSTNEGAAGNTDYPEYRNKSGFSALPGGYRGYDGKFYSIGIYGCWWCTTFGRTLSGRTYPLSQRLYYNSSDLNRRVFDEYNEGFSVRCLRD